MDVGLSLEDYAVGVGTGTCQPFYLEESLLECLPPKLRPEPGPQAAQYQCGENLPVTVYRFILFYFKLNNRRLLGFYVKNL